MTAPTLLLCLQLILIAMSGFAVTSAAPARFENRILGAFCAARFLDTLILGWGLCSGGRMPAAVALTQDIRLTAASLYLAQIFSWSFPFNRRPPLRTWIGLAALPGLAFAATWVDLPGFLAWRVSGLLLQCSGVWAVILLNRNLRRIQHPEVARGVRALAATFAVAALLTSLGIVGNEIVMGSPLPGPWVVGLRLSVSSALLVISASIVLRHNLLAVGSAGAEMPPWLVAALAVIALHLGLRWLGLSAVPPESNLATGILEWIAEVTLFVCAAVLLKGSLARLGRLLDPRDFARHQAARRARMEASLLADPAAVRVRIELGIAAVVPGARVDLLRAEDPTGLLAEEVSTIEPDLAEEVSRRGFVPREHLGMLPAAIASRFEALGGSLFLPLSTVDKVFGVVRIEAPGSILQPAIRDLRSLAELWAYKIEAHRAHAELEAARRLALLGSFAAGVAHDLRTPLNAMRLNLEILREKTGSLPPSDREYLETAIGEIDRMGRHVSDLLDCARPSAIREGECDLDAVIQEALLDVAHVRDERRIEVRTSIPPRLLIRGERVRLRQVFRNLLENAFRASFPGGSVEVSAEPAGEEVVALVRDWGKGVAPVDLPRVFEPFFTTRRGGTGLGLAIVRNIVESHGGSVTVKSDAREGTEFRVRLGRWPGPSGPVATAD